MQCDAELLRRLLDGELETTTELTAHKHLENCPECRQRLDGLAMDDFAWEKTSEFLLDDPLDQEQPARTDSASAVESDIHEHPASIEAVLGQLTASDDPRMLGRFGGYEILGIVGCGGMGVVLKGFESTLNRYVAIKVLAPHLAVSAAARKRFAREGQATASVIHPNVVAIHQVSEARGFPFLVMPYLGNEPLEKRIEQCGVIETSALIRIAMQIAQGLDAAHSQGLVHRDIKPANILLDKDVDRVVITDFGLARTADDACLTKTGVLAGTPQYMSPEQARGESVDHRSDLFSLGTVMYTMAAGHPPFRAETGYGILRRIIDDQPRNLREIRPEIPAWLCRIIEKLHAKSPADRYQSAAEVAELLRQCLTHLQTPNVPLPVSLETDNTPSLAKRFGLTVGLVSIVCAAAFWVKPKQPQTDGFTNIPQSPVQSTAETTAESDVDIGWDSDGLSETLQLHHNVRELEQSIESEL